MKNNYFFKRTLAVVLLLMASSLIWAYDFEVDGIYYNVNEDGKSVEVTWYSLTLIEKRYSGDIVIPSTVTYEGETYSVTNIGSSAFASCPLTSVKIPNSVTSIGDWAFWNCSSLASVEIPNSVTSIGRGAFYGCSALTSVEIPNSVTGIEYHTFYDCSSLTSVVIPNSVTSIGNWAFSGCTSLQEIYSNNSTPPNIYDETFDTGTEQNALLYVPVGSKADYEQTNHWKNFMNIVEIGCTTISEAEYTAYVTEFDVDFTQTEGLAAYKVTSASASYATLEEIDFAPIGTAVILNGKAGTYTLYEAENEVDEMADNIFMAGGNQVGDGSTIYALGNKAKGVGFYLVAEDVAVPADKGYLVINSTSEAKAFIPIGSGEATGIDTIAKESTETNIIYNLAGQRITEPTQSGIYIMNGKKVFINK